MAAHGVIEIGLDALAAADRPGEVDPHLADVVGAAHLAHFFRHPFEPVGHRQVLQRLLVLVPAHDLALRLLPGFAAADHPPPPPLPLAPHALAPPAPRPHPHPPPPPP